MFNGPASAQKVAWTTALRGSAFSAHVWENTLRGGDGFSTIGWAMGSVTAAAGRSSMTLGAMASLDPLTLGDCGYPRLLAQGAKPCGAHPFQDRTLPHPLIMELSLSMRRDFGPIRAGVFGALVGEPALGPPSYMHRVSAALEPIAPISHHDTNPAHAANGVLTVGLSRALARGRLTLEASAFNGKAADTDPYDIDVGSLDSWSTRAQFAAGAWRMQASLGAFPASAGGHAGHAAGGDMRAYSASLERTDMLGSAMIATTALWGRQSSGDLDPDAFLLESSAQFGRHTLFVRGESLERIEQEGHHDESTNQHIVTNRNTRVSELSGGYALRLARRFGVSASIGGRASISFIPTYREAYYNTQPGRSFALFINLQPALAAMHHH